VVSGDGAGGRAAPPLSGSHYACAVCTVETPDKMPDNAVTRQPHNSLFNV
jgi:hypothetical protein